MTDTLQRLFAHKAWADDHLLATLAALGDHPAVTGHALRALGHTLAVDRIFAAHLRRQPHGYATPQPAEPPTLATLAPALRASDAEYRDYVATLDADARAERIDFRFTDGAPGRMSREEMLMHVITHGIGHRGQVSALLLLAGLAPAPDGFTTWLHQAEASTRGRAAVAP